MQDDVKEHKLKTIIYWFRNDLRLADNPGFTEACRLADHLVPVYVHDSELNEATRWGVARTSRHRQHFLSTALAGLDEMLQQKGSKLIELQGNIPEQLCTLASRLNNVEIHCEKIVAPFEQSDIDQVRLAGIEVSETWQSSMLDFDQLPFAIENLPESFSSFRVQIEKQGLKSRQTIAAPLRVPALPATLKRDELSTVRHSTPLNFEDKKRYPDSINSFPYQQTECFGSEKAGAKHLINYFSTKLALTYKETRDQLSGLDYSTKFSPWLALGSLSAPTIIKALNHFEDKNGANKSTYWIWFELLWRDYFRLLHFKYGKALYRAYGIASQQRHSGNNSAQQYSENESFKKWREGTTAEPLVNAAMRELASTGYLSNRLRQVVASFLIYELNLDWRAGAAWFESQLVDYDVYSNQGNWLYIAGRGSDPRGGRRFNIQKQTDTHDPQGHYRLSWGCT